MENHAASPFDGYRLLEQMNSLTKESRVIVMEHHERHDGKGYPVSSRATRYISIARYVVSPMY